MDNKQSKGVSRRQFLGTAVVGIAGITMFSSLAACKQKVTDDKLKLGFIGMGRQAMYLLSGFISIPGIRVVAEVATSMELSVNVLRKE